MRHPRINQVPPHWFMGMGLGLGGQQHFALDVYKYPMVVLGNTLIGTYVWGGSR